MRPNEWKKHPKIENKQKCQMISSQISLEIWSVFVLFSLSVDDLIILDRWWQFSFKYQRSYSNQMIQMIDKYFLEIELKHFFFNRNFLLFLPFTLCKLYFWTKIQHSILSGKKDKRQFGSNEIFLISVIARIPKEQWNSIECIST